VPFAPPLGPYFPPAVLPIGNYAHVGQLKFISSDEQLYDNPKAPERFVENFRGRYLHLIHAFGKFRDGWMWELPESSLNDHAPLYYAIHVWNIYERDFGR
jgi:triacylglycerol lipase